MRKIRYDTLVIAILTIARLVMGLLTFDKYTVYIYIDSSILVAQMLAISFSDSNGHHWCFIRYQPGASMDEQSIQ